MARTIRTKVYKFNELNETAQQTVIENNYDINVDYDWWDYNFMIDIFKQFDIDAKVTGFDLDRGNYISIDMDLNFYKLFDVVNSKVYEKEFPTIGKDYGLMQNFRQIDRRVLKLINDGFITVSIDVKPENNRSSFNVNIDFENSNYNDLKNINIQLEILSEDITEILTDLNSMSLTMLKNEYEYLTGKDAIIETIVSNDYEFTIEGKRF
jgi:hypothetical protein